MRASKTQVVEPHTVVAWAASKEGATPVTCAMSNQFVWNTWCRRAHAPRACDASALSQLKLAPAAPSTARRTPASDTTTARPYSVLAAPAEL